MINLDEDDEGTESLNKQFQIVNDIVELVAKDSPTDGIRRLVQMMRHIFNCTRKRGESPALFARRYQALALDYLNHCDTATIQQDSQNFAMLLLENAKIPASVYSSIITRLVSTITSRSDSNSKRIFVISKERLELIKSKTSNLQQLAEEHDTSPEFSNTHLDLTRHITNAVTATIKANEMHVKQDRTLFRITLDDAVEVLKDLKVEDEDEKGDDTNTDAKRIGTMLGKRDYYSNEQPGYRGRYVRDKKQKSYIPNGQGPKAVSRCGNCDELNHWYRDPECIYNMIKALMEDKEIPSDVVQKLSPAIRDLFKDENGNYLSKIPVSKLVASIGDEKVKSDVAPSSNAKSNNSYFRSRD